MHLFEEDKDGETPPSGSQHNIFSLNSVGVGSMDEVALKIQGDFTFNRPPESKDQGCGLGRVSTVQEEDESRRSSMHEEGDGSRATAADMERIMRALDSMRGSSIANQSETSRENSLFTNLGGPGSVLMSGNSTGGFMGLKHTFNERATLGNHQRGPRLDVQNPSRPLTVEDSGKGVFINKPKLDRRLLTPIREESVTGDMEPESGVKMRVEKSVQPLNLMLKTPRQVHQGAKLMLNKPVSSFLPSVRPFNKIQTSAIQPEKDMLVETTYEKPVRPNPVNFINKTPSIKQTINIPIKVEEPKQDAPDRKKELREKLAETNEKNFGGVKAQADKKFMPNIKFNSLQRPLTGVEQPKLPRVLLQKSSQDRSSPSRSKIEIKKVNLAVNGEPPKPAPKAPVVKPQLFSKAVLIQVEKKPSKYQQVLDHKNTLKSPFKQQRPETSEMSPGSLKDLTQVYDNLKSKYKKMSTLVIRAENYDACFKQKIEKLMSVLKIHAK